MSIDSVTAVSTAKEVFALTRLGQAYSFAFKNIEPEMFSNIQDYIIQAEASQLSRQEVAISVATYVYNCMNTS